MEGNDDTSKSDFGCSESELSHKDAMEMVLNKLTNIVTMDPLLKDVPTPLMLDEINALIALEYGQAMTVNVVKADGEVLPVIVKQSARVFELKRAIRRATELKLMRSKTPVKISWRYVWKTYWLYFQGQKLDKDHKYLKDYGVTNRETVTFLKRLKEKQ
ncbi:U11/U12 small nuclear ribonucleoprotein [Chamberlinius hualienensis]